MKSEYMRFSTAEKTFATKSFLQSQLELLQLANGLQNFRKLRKEEFYLKISLKNRIEELLEFISVLEKTFPKTTEKIESSEERKKEKKMEKDLTLEREIENIKNKLENLNRGI
jgi:hypothetical protein